MKPDTTSSRTFVLAALAAVFLGVPAHAQYREYYVRGRVVDTEKNPLPGVEIRLRDVATSRDYHVKSGKDGKYELAGLPHGLYEVTFSKEGYAAKSDQWKLEAPQERMQKVDLPDAILASEARIREVQTLKEAEAGIKAAGDRIKADDPDRAIALLKPLLEKRPDDENALFFIGIAYARKKMYREAVEAQEKVARIKPEFPSAYFELGVSYRHLGENEKALAAYAKNLELDPRNADSAYNSGLILFELNRVEEALARFEQGLAARPADPELLQMAGVCCLNQGRYEAAVAHLEKARGATNDPAKIAFLDEMLTKVKTRLK
jgi:tetratricopeptide (TPR) repeat protein